VYALRALECARVVGERSRALIRAFGAGESGSRGFANSIEALLPCFRDTVEALPKLRVGRLAAEIPRHLGDPAALQKVHREYLLALDQIRLTRRKA
jgi:hypothetical protein